MYLRIISFDIEVLPNENGQFPTAEICPVTMISCTLNSKVNLKDFNGEDIKSDNIIFLLRKNNVGNINFDSENGRVIIEFLDEKFMLNEFFRFMNYFNSDVITGYNINGFDIPYVVDRSKVLGIDNVKIGRSDSNLFYTKYMSKGMMTYKVVGVDGRIVFDVLYILRREDASNTFLKKYNLKRLSLEHVSYEILGVEKLDFSISKMIEYWKDNDNKELVNEFVNYCSRDSFLALEFVTRFRLLDRFLMLSKRSGKLPQAIINSAGSGVMVENLLLKEFKKNDRIMSCRSKTRNKDDDDKELIGAFVLEPELGITDNIASVDYKSLYPSIMIKHNLSYDTVIMTRGTYDFDDVNEINEEDIEVQTFEDGKVVGKFIKKEKHVGIVPNLLKDLLNERTILKKEMKKHDKDSVDYLLLDASQNAVKILLNSMYGYGGDKRAKVYNWTVASAVTANGRKRIHATKSQIEDEIGVVYYDNNDYKLTVVASDTDSCYVKVDYLDENMREGVDDEISRDAVIHCINYVIEEVNKKLEKPMELAFENYIKRILVVAKKRYAMLIEDDNGRLSITTKGLESVRRDWTDMTTETITKVVETLLYEKDVNVGVNKVIEIVKECVNDLKNGNIEFEKLILTNKLTKPITSYDNKEPHVMVAIKMKERGRPSNVGDRIGYIITNNGKKLIGERAEEADYVIENNISVDVDYYINNQLIKPVLRMVSLFGITKDVLNVKLNDSQGTLMEYF